MADNGGALPIEREVLVDLSASLGARDAQTLERALRLAARFAEPDAVDEVLLQAHLFVGFPLVLEALLMWRAVLPRAAPAASAEGADDWTQRGPTVCRVVYGANYDKLRANVAALHPDLDDWMVVGGYGRVIGRPGLDLATRELCIVALLVVWHAPRQLHSHIRGALHSGASTEELSAAVGIACRHLERGRAEAVSALLAGILRAARAGPAPERQGRGSASQ